MEIIYALADPRDGAVRYIGKTQNPIERLMQHLKCHEDNHAKNEWIRELLASGYMVRMEMLEQVYNPEEVKDKEAYWIQQYQEQGAQLFNSLIPCSTIQKITRKRFGIIRVAVFSSYISLIESVLKKEKQQGRMRDQYHHIPFQICKQEAKPDKGILVIFLAVYSEYAWTSLLKWLEAAKYCGVIKSYKQARHAELQQRMEKQQTLIESNV